MKRLTRCSEIWDEEVDKEFKEDEIGKKISQMRND